MFGRFNFNRLGPLCHFRYFSMQIEHIRGIFASPTIDSRVLFVKNFKIQP